MLNSLQNGYFRFSIARINNKDINNWSNLPAQTPFRRLQIFHHSVKWLCLSHFTHTTINQRRARSRRNTLQNGCFRFPNAWILGNILTIEETSVRDLRSDGSTFSAARATVRVKSPYKATSRLLLWPDAVVVEFDVGFRSLHLNNITTLNYDSTAPGPQQSSSPDEKLRVGRSCARRHSARTLRPLTFMFRAAKKLSSGQSLQTLHGGTVFTKEVGYGSKRWVLLDMILALGRVVKNLHPPERSLRREVTSIVDILMVNSSNRKSKIAIL